LSIAQDISLTTIWLSVQSSKPLSVAAKHSLWDVCCRLLASNLTITASEELDTVLDYAAKGGSHGLGFCRRCWSMQQHTVLSS
jgi:hypothetical protein